MGEVENHCTAPLLKLSSSLVSVQMDRYYKVQDVVFKLSSSLVGVQMDRYQKAQDVERDHRIVLGKYKPGMYKKRETVYSGQIK